MISNAKLKYLASFKQAKNRAESNVFIVEGEKIVREALLSDIVVEAVCATADWLNANSQFWHGRVNPDNVYEVSDEELSRISLQKTPNKVWLLALQPQMPQLSTAFDGLVLALDRIQDPGNMGTILRIADWFGIRDVVCSPDTANHLNPKVVQSSMGSVFRIRVHYTDLEKFLGQCADKGKCVYGAMLDGEDVYHAELSANAVLVIGNESKGIGSEVAKHITKKIAIPNIGGTCESLNASVATGIFCSEFRRRKQ